MKEVTFIGDITKLEAIPAKVEGRRPWYTLSVTDNGVTYPVKCFGHAAGIASNLKEGTMVRVTAKLTVKEYNGKFYLDLQGDNIEALSVSKTVPDDVAQIPF